MTTAAGPDPVSATPQSSGGQPLTNRRVLFLRLALVTAGYFAASHAGQLLVLDPLHASPIWPAAGISLASLLIWGSRLWPGVWLGAFLFNFLVHPSVAAIFLAAAVASGSTLAALLGARLTRRLFTPALPLGKGSDIWRFLLLAGPLPCLISASVGVASYYLVGWMSADDIVSQWLMWWTGDSLGVVLFSPMLLSLCYGNQRLWPRCRVRIALQLFITAMLLAAGHYGLDRLEEMQALAAATNKMDAANELGFHHLSNPTRGLACIERFFAASEEVTRQEFATFTANIIHRSTILAVDWAPRVASSERPAFEAARQQEEGHDYNILEVNSSEQTVRAGERPEYFPILFSASRASLRPVPGLDHGFQEERRIAMAQARDTGTMVATRILPQPRTNQDSIIIFMPVHNQGLAAAGATVEERRMALRGFIVGLYEVKALFADLTQAAETRGLFFRVTDISPGEPAQVLMSTLPAAVTPAWHQETTFAGRTWRLDLQPKTVVWQDGGSLQSRLYLGFSMLAALLVAFAALGAASSNARVTASEIFTHAVLDSLSAHVAVLDAEGRILTTNRAWRDFAQTNDCDWKLVSEGSNYLAVCDQAALQGDKDAASVAQGIRDILDGQQGTWFHEYPCHSPSEQRWFYCTLSRFAINDTCHVVLAHANITPMRQAQTALQESQDRYRRLVENLGSEYFFYQHDTSGRMQYASPSVQEILGYPAEAFRGHYLEYTLDSEENQAVAANTDLVLRGRQSTYTVLARCQDGSGRWLEVTEFPVRDTAGQVIGVEGIAHDIHQRRLDEVALRQFTEELETKVEERAGALKTANDLIARQEEEVRATLDNLLDCVITINDQGIVESANKAVQKVLGYTPEELIGYNVSKIPAEPYGSHHDEYIARYLRSGDPHIIGIGREVEGRHRDGRLIPLELSVSEFQSHGQRFFTGVLRDISERKRLIADLTEARKLAEQANRAKSIFLATMSHEIRTPMNGVIGMVEVLEQSTLSTSQVDMVHTIRDSAINLLGLIDDILDFSKAEAGYLEMEQVPVALVELIEDLCQSLVPMMVAKGIHFDLFIAPAVPELVIGDALRLRQVFYNLLGNAIKFSDPAQTHQPGRISLRVEVAQARPLQLLFRVSDNGIGMTPETVAQLFTPFSQGEMSTTRRFGGTGLGLTICHRIMTIMGGDIVVESRPNKGTTFSVTLPLTAPEEQPHHSWPDLTGVDCLLADSPDLDRAGLSVYLEYAGARVVATATVSADSPLVVILDGGNGMIPKETLLAPFVALPNIRAVLLLTRGRRRRARQEINGMVTLDGVAMRRQSFVNAVALAAGRTVAEPLPQKQAKEMTLGQGATLPSIAEAMAQGRLILVAEDDEINQKVILQQLALLGQRAEVADNGAEALYMWREGDYALLLTDLHMPEMDGYTLAKTIRREENGGRRMPILALTANASQGEVHHSIAAGMDEYLTKPIRLQTLQAALSKWLPPTQEPSLPAPQPEPSSDNSETIAVVMDVTVLQGLVGDDHDTVREFLADYLAAAQRLGAELSTAAAIGDGEQVQAIAHKLKSSSRTVGAGTLADLCASLEKAGQARDRDRIHQVMTDFTAMLEAVKTACRTWLTKHEKGKRP